MTREEFIKMLDEKGYSYKIEEDKKIVLDSPRGFVDLRHLETLPQGIVFNNGGFVNLSSLQTLPQGIEFKNGGRCLFKFHKCSTQRNCIQ
jgi:hypothetical protein